MTELPYLKEGLLGILIVIAGAIFGKEKWRKDRSASNLVEAQDSEQTSLMRDLREERRDANNRADTAYAQLVATREELAKERELLLNEIAGMKLRGAARDARVERQRKQLGALAMMIAKARPELAPLMQESGFIDFDDSGGSNTKPKEPR